MALDGVSPPKQQIQALRRLKYQHTAISERWKTCQMKNLLPLEELDESTSKNLSEDIENEEEPHPESRVLFTKVFYFALGPEDDKSNKTSREDLTHGVAKSASNNGRQQRSKSMGLLRPCSYGTLPIADRQENNKPICDLLDVKKPERLTKSAPNLNYDSEEAALENRLKSGKGRKDGKRCRNCYYQGLNIARISFPAKSSHGKTCQNKKPKREKQAGVVFIPTLASEEWNKVRTYSAWGVRYPELKTQNRRNISSAVRRDLSTLKLQPNEVEILDKRPERRNFKFKTRIQDSCADALDKAIPPSPPPTPRRTRPNSLKLPPRQIDVKLPYGNVVHYIV